MEVLTKAELQKRYPEFLQKIQRGMIFIHPTDTIYGIGCDARNDSAVQKIRQLKQQFTQPLSVWVPSKEWVQKNCGLTKETAGWLSKLPGPYTLIVPLRSQKSVSDGVTLKGKTLGIRLPQHWLSKVVAELGFPIVTTSANRTGETFMTSLEDVDTEIEKGIEVMIYEGPKTARPSKIINMVKRTVKER